jgi:16S rRNA (uracil1498-N3)-methyltransferase
MPCTTIRVGSCSSGRGSKFGERTCLTSVNQPAFIAKVATSNTRRPSGWHFSRATDSELARPRETRGSGSGRPLRVYVDQGLGTDTAVLDAGAAHYVGHVLRLRRGDAVVLFNGRGEERHATLTRLGREHASLVLGAAVAPQPASPLDLRLFHGLAKAEAMDWIVQKATELGVAALQPVVTQFSVVRLEPERAERRLEHWRRVSEHACEQCGRHTPLAIAPPETLIAALAALPTAGLRLAFDLGATRDLSGIEAPANAVILACGPEGGFGPEDRKLLATAGFLSVTLGPRVLRTETAAIAASTLLQARWGDLSGPGV